MDKEGKMKYVIEFRNGRFYGGPDLERSVARDKAVEFDSVEEAEKVAGQYLLHGPLVFDAARST